MRTLRKPKTKGAKVDTSFNDVNISDEENSIEHKLTHKSSRNIKLKRSAFSNSDAEEEDINDDEEFPPVNKKRRVGRVREKLESKIMHSDCEGDGKEEIVETKRMSKIMNKNKRKIDTGEDLPDLTKRSRVSKISNPEETNLDIENVNGLSIEDERDKPKLSKMARARNKNDEDNSVSDYDMDGELVSNLLSTKKSRSGRSKNIRENAHSDSDEGEDKVVQSNKKNTGSKSQGKVNGSKDSEIENENISDTNGTNDNSKDIEKEPPNTSRVKNKRTKNIEESVTNSDIGDKTKEKFVQPAKKGMRGRKGKKVVNVEEIEKVNDENNFKGHEADHSESGSDNEVSFNIRRVDIKAGRSLKGKKIVEDKDEHSEDENEFNSKSDSNKLVSPEKSKKMLKGNNSENMEDDESIRKKDKSIDGKKKTAKNVEENYEVEQVVDMQTRKTWKCPVKFRIRWVGYGEKDDSWLRLDDLDCDDLINDFLDISGRKSEYEKILESRIKKSEVVPKKSARNLGKYTVAYYNSEDEEEYIPSGTSTRAPKFIRTFSLEQQRAVMLKKKKKIKEVENYEVEKIVNDRLQDGEQQYQVKWKGFSSKDNSWLNVKDLSCPKLVSKYNKVKDSSDESDDQDWQLKKTMRKSTKKKIEAIDEDEDSNSDQGQIPKEKPSVKKPIIQRSKRMLSKNVKYTDDDDDDEEVDSGKEGVKTDEEEKEVPSDKESEYEASDE